MTGNRYRLIGRVLALALLVAQFGAEIHFYSHSLGDPTERLGAAPNCGYCLASSQLQIAVGAPASAMPIRSLDWATIVPEPIFSGIYHAPFRAFRSRAPPTLL
ncbi:MAG TPA: hypothetical protein VGA24_02205 [Steroidobacteraceae bacterium]